MKALVDAGHFTVPADKEMALWSGGIGMSAYAIEKGKFVVEETGAGILLNGLSLWKEWKCTLFVWDAVAPAPSPPASCHRDAVLSGCCRGIAVSCACAVAAGVALG